MLQMPMDGLRDDTLRRGLGTVARVELAGRNRSDDVLEERVNVFIFEAGDLSVGRVGVLRDLLALGR